MRGLAKFLDIPIDESRFPAIVEHCTFDYMKAHAAASAPLGGALWDGGAETFINKDRRRAHGEVRDSWVELGEHHADLEAGQLRAEAEVRAEATEGDLRAWLAGDVEPLRGVEHRLVAVGRQVVHRHPVTGLDPLAGKHGVVGDGTAKVQDRRRPPQQLLDGGQDSVGVGRDPHALLGVVGERQDAVAECVARGLVAGNGQQQEELHQLVVIESLAVDLRREQSRQDVVAGGTRPAVGDQRGAVGEHLSCCLGQGLWGRVRSPGPRSRGCQLRCSR